MRSAALQELLDQAGAALAASTTGQAARVASLVVQRWARPGVPGEVTPARLPVCDHIAPALDHATGTGREPLARALRALLPQLAFARRASAQPSDTAFWNGHANAEILGPRGLEKRDDLWLGVTIMAPGTDYPKHNHAPEEVYLALSPGEWWNDAMDWTDPGLTGAIHNPPGIAHAMRSGQAPLLALWFLPL